MTMQVCSFVSGVVSYAMQLRGYLLRHQYFETMTMMFIN